LGSHKEHKGNKEERAMDGKEEKAAERLTGKERLLRGGKVFWWMFNIVSVLTMSALCRALVRTDPDLDKIWTLWGSCLAAALLNGLFVGGLSGLIVMAFSWRQRWHGVLAVGIALVADLVWWVA